MLRSSSPSDVSYSEGLPLRGSPSPSGAELDDLGRDIYVIGHHGRGWRRNKRVWVMVIGVFVIIGLTSLVLFLSRRGGSSSNKDLIEVKDSSCLYLQFCDEECDKCTKCLGSTPGVPGCDDGFNSTICSKCNQDHNCSQIRLNCSKQDNFTNAPNCSTTKSPIDLPQIPAPAPNRDLKSIGFNENYNSDLPFQIIKTNNSFQIQLLSTKSKAMIKGDSLNGEYIFHQLHFHWGSVSGQGSEHTIGGTQFDLELHFVHYSTIYESYELAFESKYDSQAIAIIGVLGLVTNTSLDGLWPIIKALKTPVQLQDNHNASADNLRLLSLIPYNDQFYRYNGSLGCSAAAWIVFSQPVNISFEQIEGFRSLGNSVKSKGVQPRGDRDIEIW